MSTPLPDLDGRNEWRRHWRPQVGATIGIATGFAVWMYTASVFVIPLQHAFGWTRGQIAIASSAQVLSGLLAPFLGALVDRFGARRLATAGMTILAGIYLGLANMGGVYVVYQTLMVALIVSGLATSGICFSRVITSWFYKSRGSALALSRIGIAVVGGFLPIANHAAIAHFGWQAGFYIMAALALCAGLPACLFLVSEPRDRRDTPERTALKLQDLWSVLLRKDAAIIVATAALSYAALGGLLSQFQPILIDQGLADSDAAGIVGLFAISAVIGALVTGPLLDRVPASRLAASLTILPISGCMLLTTSVDHRGLVALAVFLIAFAQGAEFDIMAYLIARRLGLQAYSAMYGVCIMATNITAALGAVLVAFSYDAIGDYRAALIGAALFFLATGLLYLCLSSAPPNTRSPLHLSS